MPNHPVVVSGAIVVISVAVAAAIAVYESPQARQFAEDVRRRIANALHSLGDDINPHRQPRFNRPEDAEGFLHSTGGQPGVDADEETKRRQREELMYWNAVRLEKMEKDKKLAASETANRSRGASFDDFLEQDHTAERGTLVYNTGADVIGDVDEGLRNRGLRGLNRGSVYANPFSDEHNIDADEQRAIDASLMSPEASERFEVLSDIYSATDYPEPSSVLRRSAGAAADPLNVAGPSVHSPAYVSSRQTTATLADDLVDTSEPVPDPPVSYPSLEMLEEQNFTNMANSHDASAYASIHAWADEANNSFYSPLPATPRAATPSLAAVPGSPTFSDPPFSVPGSGEATPTDSMSVADSGEEVWAPRSGATSDADVMSIDGRGISTPGSWTEVGSVVSENDVGSGMHN